MDGPAADLQFGMSPDSVEKFGIDQAKAPGIIVGVNLPGSHQRVSGIGYFGNHPDLVHMQKTTAAEYNSSISINADVLVAK